MKIKVVAITLLTISIICIVVFLSQDKYQDLFMGLSEGMTEEEVHNILYERGYKRISQDRTHVTYEVESMGRKGEMQLLFRDDEYGFRGAEVTFEKTYQSREELREQEEDLLYAMVECYEEKYGVPNYMADIDGKYKQSFCYEWLLEDNIKLIVQMNESQKGECKVVVQLNIYQLLH